MKRRADAMWRGTGLEGQGSLSTQSGAFQQQAYSFKTRFKNEDGEEGTNPEELLAAAHAGCFNMALSFMLNGEGFTAEDLATQAVVEMENEGVHWKVSKIRLHLKGKVPGISAEKFKELAEGAKKSCPISQALAAVNIELVAELV